MDKEKLLEELLQAHGGDISALQRELEAKKRQAQQAKNQAALKDKPVLVTFSDVTKTYKLGKQPVAALQNASVNIYEGEIVALIGPSGSGKSTMLNIMSGLDTPTTGTVTIAGQDITKLSNNQRAKFRSKNLGFVFQFFYLQPFLNLQTNVEVPAMFAGIGRAERAARSKELVDAVGLGDRLKHLPKELSGGQMQRAAIARALLNRPKLLLADEPTGNLDSQNSSEVVELFQKVRAEFGTTIVLVTHDHKIAEQADRIIELKDGRVL